MLLLCGCVVPALLPPEALRTQSMCILSGPVKETVSRGSLEPGADMGVLHSVTQCGMTVVQVRRVVQSIFFLIVCFRAKRQPLDNAVM